MKKKLFWLGCLAAALTFNSCSDDDDELMNDDTEQRDSSDDDGENGGGNGENEGEYEGQKEKKEWKNLLSLGETTDDMMNFISKMPTGKYTFYDEDGNAEKVVVKTSDNALFLLNPNGLQMECNVVGGTIWDPNWIVGPEKTGYMYFNDLRSDGSFAPSLHAYQYIQRDSVWQKAVATDVLNGDNAYNKVFSYLFLFNSCKRMVENIDAATLKSKSGTLNGIPCTIYYPSNGENSFEFGVTDNGFVVNWGSNESALLNYRFEKIDNVPFEQMFKKLMGEYNVHGAFDMSSCIQSTKRYETKISTSRIPSEAVHYVHYDGDVLYYDISYNTWKTMNGFVGITFESRNATKEQVRAYIKKVKGLNLCTVDDDSDFDMQITYDASNWDCTEVGLGIARYPHYNILYIEMLNYLKVEYTEDLVSGV